MNNASGFIINIAGNIIIIKVYDMIIDLKNEVIENENYLMFCNFCEKIIQNILS
jgi:hypothetical protein